MDEHRSTAPRRHFAGGDYLTRYPESAPYALRIDTPRPKPGWEARQEGSQLRAVHAGTPVLFEGRTFEVRVRERSPRGDRWVYLLAPWDDRLPLRPPHEYDRESCEREAAEHRRRQLERRDAHLLLLFAPLVALLPAGDQRRLERELGFPAVRATLASGVLLLSASAAVIVAGMAQSAAGGTLPGLGWTVSALPWAVYFALESGVRFLSAIRFDEPMGSLPVWLPIETVRALRRALDPESRQERKREEQVRRRSSDDLAGARDAVGTAMAADGVEVLEVVSLLPKPHWTINVTAIYIGETCYYLAGREVRDAPDGPRYVFHLRQPDGEMFFREVVHYDPIEVRALAAERRRQERSTWVETFAALFGFLDAGLQERLAERFEYDPQGATRSSVVAGLVLGLAGTFVPLRYLASFGVTDLLILVGGLALLAESVVRARRLVAGEIRGGALGRLLRPLAERLLD